MLSGMSEMFPYFQFNRQVSPVGMCAIIISDWLRVRLVQTSEGFLM